MDKFECHVWNMQILEMQHITESIKSINRCKSKIGLGVANGIIFDARLNPAWPIIERLDHGAIPGRLIILRTT